MNSRTSWLLGVFALSCACGPADTPEEESDATGAIAWNEWVRDPSQIHAFLSAGEYLHWTSESSVLESANGSGRRVFLNPDQAVSMAESRGLSTLGSAAVREMYGPSGEEQIGWAVAVKVATEGLPSDWFFYETFDLDSPENHTVASRGAPGCIGCHSTGTDYIQSTYPLR